MIKIKLAVLLAERGLKQKDLAKATGIRANTICAMVHGDINNISLKNLELICEALECDVYDIYEYIPKYKGSSKQLLDPRDPNFLNALEAVVEKHINWRTKGESAEYSQ